MGDRRRSTRKSRKPRDTWAPFDLVTRYLGKDKRKVVQRMKFKRNDDGTYTITLHVDPLGVDQVTVRPARSKVSELRDDPARVIRDAMRIANDPESPSLVIPEGDEP